MSASEQTAELPGIEDNLVLWVCSERRVLTGMMGQISGKALCAQSDVFALGTVVWEIL
jgi:hypothetical protein